MSAATPRELYEQTGGGDTYRVAMRTTAMLEAAQLMVPGVNKLVPQDERWYMVSVVAMRKDEDITYIDSVNVHRR